MNEAWQKHKEAVENALEVLVLAYEAERDKPHESDEDTYQSIKGEAMAAVERILEKKRRPWANQLGHELLIRRPMLGALRLAIREVGEHIWQKTESTNAMTEVLENVAARHPSEEEDIFSAISHVWDGIGGDGDLWVC